MNNVKTYLIAIITVVMLALIPQTSMAQGKYGATPDDSVKCVENLSVYKDFLREKNYKKAKKYWSIAFNTCPGASLKMYVDGEKILEGRIKEVKDNKERVSEILDTLMLLYDRRIENFGREGYVLGKKGADQYKYRYPGYEAAYNTLKRSIELDGNDAQPAAIIYYFQAAIKMNDGKEVEPSFWIDMFNQCGAIIDHNLKATSDTRKLEGYTKALESILKLADPYLTCDVLIEFYNSKYEEKKEDQEWLKNAADVLDSKDCSGDPVFYKIANQLHSLNPSSASAKNLGIMSVKKEKYGDAVKFFTQAIDLADDNTDDENLDANLADLELMLAKSYFGTSNFAASRTHAMKAAGYKSGWGDPYMLIGDLYAASVSKCTEEQDGVLKSPYWVAVDMYMKAKSVDASLASDASQKIAKYSQYFPTTQDAFFYGVTDGSDYTVGCWIQATTKARLR